MKRSIFAFVLLFCLFFTSCTEQPAAVIDSLESPKQESGIPIVSLTTFTAFETIQGKGKEDVENALNTYFDANGYPFHIQLNILNMADYPVFCDMNLSAGKDIDIFLSVQLSAHVAQNAVLPLDDYFENELKDAVSLFDQQWLDCSLYQAHHYAIPAHTASATTIYYICREDLLQEIGFDESKVSDIESLEMLFAQVKKYYPDMWCTDAKSITTADILNVTGDTIWGFLGDNKGVGMEKSSAGIIENYFASETFEEACRIARRWYEKGYLNPAGSTDSTYCPDYIASGESFGWLVGNCNTAESQAAGYRSICGKPLIAIPIAESAESNAGFSWAIAKNSEHPSESARLLNLLYTDPYVLNTICYGIEGVDYVWNEDHSLAFFPEGESRISVPYSYYVGTTVLGDRMRAYPFVEYNTADDLAYISEKIAHPLRSPVFGMSFDTHSIQDRTAAVGRVVDQYEGALLSGELDTDQFLPQFLSDLQAAGINEIVAEAQQQYDTWANRKSYGN